MIRITQPYFDLRQICESGQCFRMARTTQDEYRIIAQGRVLTLCQQPDGTVLLNCDENDFHQIWRDYFDLQTDYGRFVRAAEGEGYLARAASHGQGIRILKQDAFEVIITFIISQRKNIPAIKRAVETLCTLFGTPIGLTGAFAFPTARRLASLHETALAPCALGYRTKYVLGASRLIAGDETAFHNWAGAPDEQLRAALLALPGVGKKVADCAMLFGYHRLDAFPVDVWINRVLDAEYQGGFPAERYRGFGGVMQQYLFYYARSQSAREIGQTL